MSSAAQLFAGGSDACISPCERYRYWLKRRWNDLPPVCWVMLNPSTADASIDDPTIRRCIGLARDWGFGGIVVVNLFAFRATDPRLLRSIGLQTAVGPDNDAHLLSETAGRKVIAAWGCSGALCGRDRRVMSLLTDRHLYCVGTTKDGYPRHPLYVRGDVVPIPFAVPPPSAGSPGVSPSTGGARA